MENQKDEKKKRRSEWKILSSLLPRAGIREGRQTGLIEKRNLVSSVFIAMLIGLAYQEMITTVRQAVHASGITWGTVILFSVFFLTSIRFFIGNQLHLLSDALVRMRGDLWFFDFMVITFQTSLLAFLGGASCVDVCRVARVGFVDILLALYVVDVIWILLQWVLGKLFAGWRREFIPWAWAILNTLLAISLIVLQLVFDDIYSDAALIWLVSSSAAAFVVDIVLVDYFNLI